MGTWDESSFGNDTACDWSFGLDGTEDLEYVEKAFDRVLNAKDKPIESDAGEEAIAAAEVIARLLGNWGDESSYTETTDTWVREHSDLKPSIALIDKAKRTLERITRPKSELLELWEESGGSEGWTDEVSDLQQRLEKK